MACCTNSQQLISLFNYHGKYASQQHTLGHTQTVSENTHKHTQDIKAYAHAPTTRTTA